MLAGQTQVASAETLYDKVSKLAAAVDALEKKSGGIGGVSSDDLKCGHPRAHTAARSDACGR